MCDLAKSFARLIAPKSPDALLRMVDAPIEALVRRLAVEREREIAERIGGAVADQNVIRRSVPTAEGIRFLINLLLRPPVLVAWRQMHVGSPIHRVAQALLVPRPDPRHGSKYSVPTNQGM